MAAGSARLRSADALISPDVAETVAKLPDLTEADAAAVKLAKRYAAAIDQAGPDDAAEVLDRLGPKLLAALESLGATPRSRAARKGGASVPGQGKLQALREARRPA
ncbi:terminase small subunit [Micromonospora globbae]|uniref:Terminase small subunit actinomycetes phage-type domain-containing protein n=1 Tax=Micromonospora globbae TaxID=1894969 RepID=A0A420ETX4_9ACTN|nr:hypothetical protein [Micromonospora globbae]RKF24132.1 hypothetical protein D7I43_28015 [Micromonospora globbae]